MSTREPLNRSFFLRRSNLLRKLRDKKITDSELLELSRTKDLLDEYIFEMKEGRNRAKNGKMTI